MNEQKTAHGVGADLRSREGVGQRFAREEVLAHLEHARSVLIVGAPGLGGDEVLEDAVAESARRYDDWLVVRPPVTPYTGLARRFADLVRAIRRAAGAVRADVVWEGLAEAWQADEQATGSDDELGVVLERLAAMLADVADAEPRAVIAVTVTTLRDWLPEGAGADAGAEAVGRWLRGVLRGGRGGLRLVTTDAPDVGATREAPIADVLDAVEQVPMEPLSEDEAVALLAERAPSLEGEDARFVYRMVGGHPRLVGRLGQELARWARRRSGIDDAARVSLAGTLDAEVEAVVEHGLLVLRRLGEGTLLDRLFAASGQRDEGGFAAAELTLLWPLGLVDARGRIPERLRLVMGRGATVARTAGDADADADGSSDGGLAADDPLLELGRKERVVFHYLRERPGMPVAWLELAAAYFGNDPEALQDEEKALGTLRAAVNRINTKLAPSEKAARAGWKVVRYARGRGFYADKESLESISH